MYEQYTKLIATHESMVTKPKYTSLFVYLWFMAIFGMPVIGRHTKLGHGHLLSVWKAPIGPDTLEISHDSSFCTERPENPIELG